MVAKADEKFASMIWAGARPRPPFAAIAPFTPRWAGIATSMPSRNTPPMMNAPITA